MLSLPFNQNRLNQNRLHQNRLFPTGTGGDYLHWTPYQGFDSFNVAGVLGVFKAYSTRVGSGPMPTELHDETAELLREKAHEYGVTTGRPRRVGWFDAIAARYSRQINGFTGIVFTRLDILDGFPTVLQVRELARPTWTRPAGWGYALETC